MSGQLPPVVATAARGRRWYNAAMHPVMRMMSVFDPRDALFVIVRGRVRLMRGRAVITELGPGEEFGEMAVLDEAPRSASAVAVDETALPRIGREEFSEILHEQAEIAEGVIRVLRRRLREANAKLLQAPANAQRAAG
jgi:CRP-like cAMP-binding protein